MEASIRKENDHQVTLILDGRLDTSVTQETELEVEPLFDYKDCEVVIDCSRLDYISSSGLRLMMAIRDSYTCSSSGSRCTVAGGHEVVGHLAPWIVECLDMALYIFVDTILRIVQVAGYAHVLMLFGL